MQACILRILATFARASKKGQRRQGISPDAILARMAQQGRRRGFGRKSKDAKLALLGAVPLFSACTKRDLSRIAALVEEVEAPRGKVMMRQGDPGRECYVISEGTAKATMRGRGSASLGPGDFFGEMALLDQGPRTATVTAETDMHLLVLNSREFFSLLDAVPGVAQRIMRGLAERLREPARPRPQH
jgi:CRP/FNR family cyclic AMP-dependent transcriptional regulator